MITEEQLHAQICDYLHAQYPKVMFNTDMSGVKLTIGQAKKAKKLRSNNGFPDIVIYEACISTDGISIYISYALFLEVKKVTPYKKNGQLKKMLRYEFVNGIKTPYDHYKRQQDMLDKLNNKNYKAEFVWTFDMAKIMIDRYLNDKL